MSISIVYGTQHVPARLTEVPQVPAKTPAHPAASTRNPARHTENTGTFVAALRQARRQVGCHISQWHFAQKLLHKELPLHLGLRPTLWLLPGHHYSGNLVALFKKPGPGLGIQPTVMAYQTIFAQEEEWLTVAAKNMKISPLLCL